MTVLAGLIVKLIAERSGIVVLEVHVLYDNSGPALVRILCWPRGPNIVTPEFDTSCVNSALPRLPARRSIGTAVGTGTDEI